MKARTATTFIRMASRRHGLLGAAILAVTSLLGMASASFGALVTIDADTFAAGTNISNATAGVVLSAPVDPNGLSVFVKQRSPIGGNAFAYSTGGVNLSENFFVGISSRRPSPHP